MRAHLSFLPRFSQAIYRIYSRRSRNNNEEKKRAAENNRHLTKEMCVQCQRTFVYIFSRFIECEAMHGRHCVSDDGALAYLHWCTHSAGFVSVYSLIGIHTLPPQFVEFRTKTDDNGENAFRFVPFAIVQRSSHVQRHIDSGDIGTRRFCYFHVSVLISAHSGVRDPRLTHNNYTASNLRARKYQFIRFFFFFSFCFDAISYAANATPHQIACVSFSGE